MAQSVDPLDRPLRRLPELAGAQRFLFGRSRAGMIPRRQLFRLFRFGIGVTPL